MTRVLLAACFSTIAKPRMEDLQADENPGRHYRSAVLQRRPVALIQVESPGPDDPPPRRWRQESMAEVIGRGISRCPISLDRKAARLASSRMRDERSIRFGFGSEHRARICTNLIDAKQRAGVSQYCGAAQKLFSEFLPSLRHMLVRTRRTHLCLHDINNIFISID